MISKKKADEVALFFYKNGTIKTSKRFKLSNESVKRYVRVANKPDGNAKIFIFDIETLPMASYTFEKGKQFLNMTQIEDRPCMLGWAGKWLCDDNVVSDILIPSEAVARDDKRICQRLWNYLNDADMVIGHNVKRFDVKYSNARFLYHGLRKPLPYSVIDTLSEAWRGFRFVSNRLDDLCSDLGLDVKLETGGMELWKGCYKGDRASLEKMQRYNRQDVLITEELYFKLRPWIKHPNMGLYVSTEEKTCPNCGGTDLVWKGYYRTPLNAYQAFRCSCGAVGRSRHGMSGDEKVNLVNGV